LGSSVGIVVLGFLIYAVWQMRLPSEEPPEDPEQIEEIEETEKHPSINEVHGYEIAELKVEKPDEARLFGIEEPSDFIIKYEDVYHAVFKNEDSLPIDEWIEKKIEEKGAGATLEDKKESLNIIFQREVDTSLGKGKEVIIMNDSQAGELLIPRDDYIMSFYYEAENPRDVSLMESKRNVLIESIKYR